MASSSTGADAAAAAFLKRQARSGRARLLPAVLLGLGIAACGIAQALLLALLLATLLGHGNAGWPELAAAAALALLMAALAVAQERAQLAAGEEAKSRLRAAAFARLLEAGPADHRAVGEKSALVVERIEALEGYFSRWLPAAMIAILAPLMIAAAAAVADPLSGLILLGAGLMVPVTQALTGIGAAQASRRQFAALQRLSGLFLDRMRGLPVLVLFNQQQAEASRLAAAAEELRRRTMRVLRVAFISAGAM
jgi:ATP-binding cassette subfamily C protein CydD